MSSAMSDANLQLSFDFLACRNRFRGLASLTEARKQMLRHEIRVRYGGRDHRATDHRSHEMRVLSIINYLVIEAKQRRNRPERQPCRHHQRVVHAFASQVVERANSWDERDHFRKHFRSEKR